MLGSLTSWLPWMRTQSASNNEEDDDEVTQNVERSEEMRESWISEIISDQNRRNDGNDILVDRPVASGPQKSELRIGKITSLSVQDGMIDGKYFFKRGDAPAEGLEIGKSVNFHLYRSTEEQEWRVLKILSVIEEIWNDEDDSNGNVPFEEPSTLEEEIIPIDACMERRTIVGEVRNRQNRIVTVRDMLQKMDGKSEPRYTEIDLDKLYSGFNPLEGDLVTIDAIVEVSEDVIDGNGQVLEVKSIQPTRSRTDDGIVTRWERQHHNPRHRGKGDFGVINDDIYFEKAVCEPGYIPKKDDEVRVDMIQCERDKFKWRAILVSPLVISQFTEERWKKPEKLEKVDPDLLKDKGGLVVQEITDYGMFKMTDNYKIELTVTNMGQSVKKIKYYLDSQYSNLKIISPKSKYVTIESQDHVIFCFDYKKDFLGHFSELFVIECDGFEIGRVITWEVYNSEIPPIEGDAATNGDKKGYENQRGDMAQKYMNIQKTRGTWLPGVKPNKSQSFVKVRFPKYDIDDQIKTIMTTGPIGQLAARKDSAKALKECCPELAQPLSASNHNRRFHHLLHIAEVDAQIQMSRHTKERVCFVRRGQASEYLALEIPGLSEGRPSLLVGDSVVAQESSTKRAAPLMGYVFKVLKNEVWLKFDPYIHHCYNGEDYDVFFNVSRSCFKKSHAALDICQRNQASLWLFPKGVRTKPPQVALELPEDAEFTLSDVDHCGAIVNGHTESKLDTSECSSSVQNLFESFKLSSNNSQAPISGSIVPLEDIEKSLHGTVSNERSKTALLNLVKSKSPGATSPPAKNESHGMHARRKVKLQWINSRLNQRQKEAVRNILLGEGRPLPYIIFGPPGTGKTITLVETVLQIYTLISSSRILIATPSNSSANLIAERLLDSKLLQPGDMVRLVAYHLVSEGKISPKLVPYSATVNISNNSKDDTEDFDSTRRLSCTLIMSRRIIVGTCMALGQMQPLDLPKGHFSHIVIDEAGQATEPEILIPLAFMAHESGQAILAGDPHQLGPVVQSDIASTYGLSQSLLSRLLPKFPYQRDAVGFPESGGYDPRLVTRLSVNYRSLPDILELPSSLFYDSDLEPSLSDTTSFEAKLLAQITQQLQLPHSAVIFHGIVGDECRTDDSPSLSNLQEAYAIITYVRQLLNAEVKSEDIGIITPYQKQVSLIRRMLEKLITDKEDKVQAIKIGSVEEFQGQERMIIFLSTVRSAKTKDVQEIGRNTARQLLGFVNNKERLNVAISRARSLLLICANPNVLSLDPYWRSVVKYCIDRKSYKGVNPEPQLIK